jgi:hypothetical protein
VIRANSTGLKVSSCVNCQTPIIGERLRCAACHDRHAAEFLDSSEISAVTVGDEDLTVPRDRSRREPSLRDALIAWFGPCLIIVLVVVVLMTAGRGCQ